MKNLVNHVAALLVATALSASAATIVSQAPGGDWNATNTWLGGLPPTSVDDVVISPGTSVTVSSPVACSTLSLNNSSATGSTLTISTNGSLVVGEGQGSIAMGTSLGSVTQDTETALVVNGTVHCGQIHMVARRFTGRDAECMLRVNHANAVVEVEGNIVQERNVSQGSLRNQVHFGSHGTVRIKGTFIALDAGGVPSVNGPGTIEYCNDGPQEIAGFNYNNLTLSGIGPKTGATNIIISGILTIQDGATYAGITPTYENNTFLVYAGTNAQITGPELPVLVSTNWSLTVTNVFGVTLNQSVSVSGVINLGAGAVTTGANVLTMDGTVTRVNGYVIGNLQKPVTSGSNVTRNFELGSANGYGPVALTFANVLTAGKLTVGSAIGDHPAMGSADLNAVRSVNVHWSITPAPELTFDTCNVAFNFNENDLDVGVSPALLVAGHFSGSSWTYPEVAVRTDTSLQLNGLTSFSGFQLAESGQAQPLEITWSAPADIVYGIALDGTQLNATANIAGSFAYSPAEGVVLDVGNQTLSAVFTPVDTVNYSVVTNAVGIVVQQAPLVVTANSAARAFGETNPVFAGTIVGVVNNDNISATFASSATQLSLAGDYPIVPTLNDPDNRLGNYSVTSNNGTLTISGQPHLVLSIQHLPSGLALLEIQGGSTLVCRIEATSTVGSNWQEIGTATAGVGGLQTFLDLDATNAAVRFYRVVTP